MSKNLENPGENSPVFGFGNYFSTQKLTTELTEECAVIHF